MTAYKPGDPIQFRFGSRDEWRVLGTYLATTSNGTIVCEGDDGMPGWVTPTNGNETRLAPDTVTVTVEVDRAHAAEIAGFGFTASKLYTDGARTALDAFENACLKAVQS